MQEERISATGSNCCNMAAHVVLRKSGYLMSFEELRSDDIASSKSLLFSDSIFPVAISAPSS